MSATLRDLYQAVVMDHSRQPRNRRTLAQPARTAEEYNPLCGDHVQVYVHCTDGVLHDVTFEATACAVATASASLMTETVLGKSSAETAQLGAAFRAFLADQADGGAALGALAAFSGVRAFPSRIKCALLPWRALLRALKLDASVAL